jgi:4-diphosphocytidyl-2-C-methyl-D-erythritol kinase
LNKALPHGGGVGGGSSDAAAMLRHAAAQGFDIPTHLSTALGADIPVCMLAEAARMRGIGEQVDRIALPPLPVLLVNPGVEVPTGSVFSAMSSRDNPGLPDQIPSFAGVEDCAAWLAVQRNDLEQPAISQAPQIGRVLEELVDTRDVLLARMSGSGSTCFALYPSMKAAHFAAYEIGAAQPDWWCRATTLS